MANDWSSKVVSDLGQADSAGRSMFNGLRSGAAAFGGAWAANVMNPVNNTADKVDEIGSSIGGFGGILGNIGANFLRFMFNPLTLIVGLLATAVSRIQEVENRSMNVQRAIGSTVPQLEAFTAQVGNLTDKWHHMGVRGEQITGIIQQMGNAMGSFSQVSTQAVAEITKLSLHGGASKDEFTSAYTSILQMSQGLASSKEEANKLAMSTLRYATNLAQANGVPINAMMNQLANVSDAVATTMGSNPQALSQAVVQASQLGTTLEGVASIMNNMMNIEQSIANEMEASVLLGKNLNLERLRSASFLGDQAGVMRELKSLVGSQAEFEKLLPMQRQAYAQALGMSVAELQKMAGFESQAEMQARQRQAATDKAVQITTTFMEQMNQTIREIQIAFSSVMAGPVQAFRTWLSQADAGGSTGLDKIKAAAQQIASWLQQAVTWIGEFATSGNRMGMLREALSSVASTAQQIINWLGQGNGKLKNWQIVLGAIAAVKFGGMISGIAQVATGLGGVTAAAGSARASMGGLLGVLGSVYTAYQNVADISGGNSGRGWGGMAGMALGGLMGGPMGMMIGGQIGRGISVGDAIIRPGAPPIHVHPSDTLIAVKEAAGGASYISHRGEGLMGKTAPQPITYNFDLGPVTAKLDALTSAILQGGKVYLDGHAVGRSQAMAATMAT